jgi:hypothetical protein
LAGLGTLALLSVRYSGQVALRVCISFCLDKCSGCPTSALSQRGRFALYRRWLVLL